MADEKTGIIFFLFSPQLFQFSVSDYFTLVMPVRDDPGT
jgi:hypothetical protein